MTRTQLADTLAHRLDLDVGQARSMVRHVFDLISERVHAGDEVQIYGFGRFERVCGRDRFYDPNLGRTVACRPSVRGGFSPGAKMIIRRARRLDEPVADDEQGEESVTDER